MLTIVSKGGKSLILVVVVAIATTAFVCALPILAAFQWLSTGSQGMWLSLETPVFVAAVAVVIGGLIWINRDIPLK